MIQLTRSDPSRNMHRFYAMQLGNWVTNPAARSQAANLVRSMNKILSTIDRPLRSAL
jgi:predicted DNA-binding WGR domain protein